MGNRTNHIAKVVLAYAFSIGVTSLVTWGDSNRPATPSGVLLACAMGILIVANWLHESRLAPWQVFGVNLTILLAVGTCAGSFVSLAALPVHDPQPIGLALLAMTGYSIGDRIVLMLPPRKDPPPRATWVAQPVAFTPWLVTRSIMMTAGLLLVLA